MACPSFINTDMHMRLSSFLMVGEEISHTVKGLLESKKKKIAEKTLLNHTLHPCNVCMCVCL